MQRNPRLLYIVFLPCRAQVYSFPILNVLLCLYWAHASVLPTISWYTELPNHHGRSPMGSPSLPEEDRWQKTGLLHTDCVSWLLGAQAWQTWIWKLLPFYFLTKTWEVTFTFSTKASHHRPKCTVHVGHDVTFIVGTCDLPLAEFADVEPVDIEG